MADGYIKMIDRADGIDDIDRIIENAAFNSSITNGEYEQVYKYGLQKVQSWCN